MKKELNLIGPEISIPSGGAAKKITSLAKAIRSAKAEGGEEIAALAELMMSPDLGSMAFHPVKGSPQQKLIDEFFKFIAKDLHDLPAAKSISKARGAAWPIHAFCFASATGALDCALKALNVEGGDVITTSLNYPGVVNAIVMAGARPKFVDVSAGDWCMDHQKVAAAIDHKTKAILLVHLNKFVDITPYFEMTEGQGLDVPVVQDASLAICSRCNGLRPGAINVGHRGVTVFSLTFSKLITGLGGAIATSGSADVLNRMILLGRQGLSFENPFETSCFGTNCKMSALHAAIALQSLKKRRQVMQRRTELKAIFDSELSYEVEKGNVELQEVCDDTVITHYGLLVPRREHLSNMLYLKHKIHTGIWHFFHRQGVYLSRFGMQKQKLPVTDSMVDRLVFLPFHGRLTDKDAMYICKSVKKCI